MIRFLYSVLLFLRHHFLTLLPCPAVCYTNASASVPLPRDLTHGAVGPQASELFETPLCDQALSPVWQNIEKSADRNRALISPCRSATATTSAALLP
jgi:hypothetical protein